MMFDCFEMNVVGGNVSVCMNNEYIIMIFIFMS